jgi:hypothetical protein
LSGENIIAWEENNSTWTSNWAFCQIFTQSYCFRVSSRFWKCLPKNMVWNRRRFVLLNTESRKTSNFRKFWSMLLISIFILEEIPFLRYSWIQISLICINWIRLSACTPNEEIFAVVVLICRTHKFLYPFIKKLWLRSTTYTSWEKADKENNKEYYCSCSFGSKRQKWQK